MYPRITAHTPVVQSATSLSASLSRRLTLVKPPTMDWGKSNLYLPHIQQTPTPSKRIHYGAPHAFHNPSTLLVLHGGDGLLAAQERQRCTLNPHGLSLRRQIGSSDDDGCDLRWCSDNGGEDCGRR
ncbi:unnamed protein product [Microthlaspi erraticum]|uniref:Uncharacterized protein n=1 Tax=Microthlaspi erraticum TaxID=1685480 RepID=A0A6D2IMQ4_9BRAS|nr:unnamed protein product [Microthlaspi erraticum]